jgi:hypothetical protein
VHDGHITGNDFLFTDAFRFDRSVERGANGCVLRNGQIVDAAYFDEASVGCVRGLAGGENEAVVGLSFPGSRDKRMNGIGGLLLLRESKVTHRIALPCAQVYDVIRHDGSAFPQAPAACNFSEAAALLTRSLGAPVMEWALKDALMPADMNASRNGAAESSIDEYLT